MFKLFVVVFGRDAFLPDHRGEMFHQLALREGKQSEAQVARDLSDTVFGEIFPTLGRALAVADGKEGIALDAAYLDELREGALILLYRLLFVLYAEDRNLSPNETGPYADYSMTRLRLEVAEKNEGQSVLRRHKEFLVAPRWRVPGDRARRQQLRHSAVQRRSVRSGGGGDFRPCPAT